MQEIKQDGSKGPIEQFDEEKMKQMLSSDTTKEVRVFHKPSFIKPIPEEEKNLTKESEISKKCTTYSNTQPAIVREFRLQKGMKVTINQALYKVTAARPNGKVTMKFIKMVEKT